MEEIKYRAWHFGAKEMFYPKGTVNRYGYCGLTTRELFAKFNEKELMQFTGILDKNGNEIYEGDIVYRTDTSTTGDVRFRKGKFYVSWKGEAGYVMFDSDIETCEGDEIKGNIFENSDLCDG